MFALFMTRWVSLCAICYFVILIHTSFLFCLLLLAMVSLTSVLQVCVV